MNANASELTVLGGATRYLFQSILLVRDSDLLAPTPCVDWNLGRLLRHVQASLEHFTGVLAACEIPTPEAEMNVETDPVSAIRTRIVDLLVAWTSDPTAERWCEVGDRQLSARVVVSVAAIEMILHGWDITQACGKDRPIPESLAENLVKVSPPLAEVGLVNGAFRAPLALPWPATSGERLLALFGRRSRF
jgi:uncharacterized protein (TIGR03086 family)